MNFKQRFKLNRSSLAVILLLVYDAFAVNISYFLALWLRFDCKIGDIPPEYLEAWFKYIPVNTVVSIVIFSLFKLYRSIWSFASYKEFSNGIYEFCSLCI